MEEESSSVMGPSIKNLMCTSLPSSLTKTARTAEDISPQRARLADNISEERSIEVAIFFSHSTMALVCSVEPDPTKWSQSSGLHSVSQDNADSRHITEELRREMKLIRQQGG
jgi:hypothetical protein